jgi:hypothetical protein
MSDISGWLRARAAMGRLVLVGIDGDYEPVPGEPRDATTLRGVLAELEADGYRGGFMAREGGMLECLTCKARTPVAKVRAARISRLEGASDPDDMLAVVALVCPVCAAKGTIVLNYGPEASELDDDVLQHLAM